MNWRFHFAFPAFSGRPTLTAIEEANFGINRIPEIYDTNSIVFNDLILSLAQNCKPYLSVGILESENRSLCKEYT